MNEPIHDPDLAPLDRELRRIEFVERPSFGPELRARLRDARGPVERRVPRPLAVAAIIALLMLPMSHAARSPSSDDPDAGERPVLIGAQAGGGALHLAVSETGTVLAIGKEPLPPDRGVGRLAGLPAGSAIVCAFEMERGACTPAARAGLVREDVSAPRGPFVYRDLCCGSDPQRDGIFTVAGLRETALFVFLYEDVNGDRRLSKGDRLRMRAHPAIDRPRLPLYAGRDTRAGGGADAIAHPMAIFVY